MSRQYSIQGYSILIQSISHNRRHEYSLSPLVGQPRTCTSTEWRSEPSFSTMAKNMSTIFHIGMVKIMPFERIKSLESAKKQIYAI